ncbi:MAG: hypothetical protein IJA50_02320, partial [Firmicutes bacterium]|nr:hypothetical protein [Bacillota bacterium]
MRRNKCKKLVAILLLMLMVSTSVPVTSFAETAAVNNGNSLEGKAISILGDSISTYINVSNGTASSTTNSTIKNNANFYTKNIYGLSVEDTWWMQAADDLGLELLVNNSWSGSTYFRTRAGTVGAYVDRCVQLHDDTGENAGKNPDIIGLALGTNDFHAYPSQLGNADIDYDALIKDNKDGTFTYAEPTSTLEAAAIVMHKTKHRYPNAEVYCLNVPVASGFSQDRINTLRKYNEDLAAVCKEFDVEIVDIYGSEINSGTLSYYMGDKSVHPNRYGMDVYAEAFKRAVLAEHTEVSSHKVKFELERAETDYGTDKTVIDGDAFSCSLTAEEGCHLNVKVSMNGEDITAEAYKDGSVNIGSVMGDVTIQATGVDTLSMQYDDHLDMPGKTVEIIDAGQPTSYQVGYGIEEGTLDEAVVTLEDDNVLVATGVGRAQVRIDGVIHDVTVEAAPI